MIIDTHAHYDDEDFDTDREQLLRGMIKQGISQIVNIGANMSSSEKSIALSEKYHFIYATIGVHPSDVGTMTDKDLDRLRELSRHDKVVAIGEIGLDYHYPTPDKELQKKWFRAQLALAAELKLPVCIHSREAAQDTFDILQEQNAQDIGGVIHCFSYGWDMAQKFLDLGFYLGIGGVITFKNSKKLKEVVEKMPIERLVLETDAPYLAPEPFRGKRNESSYLKYVIDEITNLRRFSREEIILITDVNAQELYRMN